MDKKLVHCETCGGPIRWENRQGKQRLAMTLVFENIDEWTPEAVEKMIDLRFRAARNEVLRTFREKTEEGSPVERLLTLLLDRR